MRFENEGLWGTKEILDESYGFGMQGYYTYGNKVQNIINRFEIHQSMRELWALEVWKWGTLRDYLRVAMETMSQESVSQEVHF